MDAVIVAGMPQNAGRVPSLTMAGVVAVILSLAVAGVLLIARRC